MTQQQQEEFISNLKLALANTINPNAELRAKSEEFVKMASRTPGYCSALLTLSCDPQVNQGTNAEIDLSAAIQLGTIVEYHWKFRDEEHAKKIALPQFDFIILNTQDKAFVRENIMKALYTVTKKKIIKQYVRCITTMCRFDYPDHWPQLLDQIIAFLSHHVDDKAVVSGLFGLKGLVKKYEYELEEGRNNLYKIFEVCYGHLGNLINMLMDKLENPEAQQVLLLICKIFYISNQLYMCPQLAEGSNLDPWIQFFIKILQSDITKDLDSFTQNQDVIEERDESLPWQLKGIAAKTTYRLMSKYGNPKFVDEKFLPFSNKFQNVFAIPLLEVHLKVVFYRKTNFVGSKCLNFAIKYLSSSTKIDVTMEHLKPFVQNLLYDTIIPIMLLSQKDINLFEEDPIEYIRRQQDFTETLFSPKNTIIDLLIYLCSYKSNKKNKRPDYLHDFLSFCAKNLTEYTQMQGQADWRIKEAILFAIGNLRDQIDKQKDLKKSIEPMLEQHVYNEMQNPNVGFLRLRACWLYGEFGDYQFKTESHIHHALDAIYKLLQDKDLPVRLNAATSLHKLLINDEANVILKPVLGDLLKQYLKIMGEIDSEELVSALEEIVKHFKNDIGPFAISLCQSLRDAYQRLIQTGVDEDDGESALAAVSCVTAIRRILDSVQDQKEILSEIQSIIFPILMHGLTPDGLDAIEDALDCIALLIYHGPQGRIHADMWKLFPQLIYVVCGDGSDPDGGYGFEYLSQISVSIQNYIAKDPETYLSTNPNDGVKHYIIQTFSFIKMVLKINANSAHYLDGIVAMKVLIAMLENLTSKIDDVMDSIITLCLSELQFLDDKKKVPKSYQSMIIQTISMSFHYNPLLTFQLLEGKQMTVYVFQKWLALMSEFKHDFELRRIIFGFSSILKLNPQSIPQVVFQRLPDIVKWLAQLCQKSSNERVKILEDNKKYLAKGVNEDQSSDDEKESQDSEQEFKEVKEKIAKMNEERKMDMENDDDLSDSDYEYTGGDLALYDSALDDVDELQHVKGVLESINSADGGYFTQLIGGMNEQEFQQFSQVLEGSTKLKAEEEDVRKKCDELDAKKNL